MEKPRNTVVVDLSSFVRHLVLVAVVGAVARLKRELTGGPLPKYTVIEFPLTKERSYNRRRKASPVVCGSRATCLVDL